jgi:glucose uptake protein GlcU
MPTTPVQRAIGVTLTALIVALVLLVIALAFADLTPAAAGVGWPAG